MPPSAAATGSAARRQLGQLAVVDLAADLQPDHEEEDHHQPVVDDPDERLRSKSEGAQAHAQRRVPQRLVALAPSGEFAQSSATAAATSSTMPLAASMLQEALERATREPGELAQRLPGLGRRDGLPVLVTDRVAHQSSSDQRGAAAKAAWIRPTCE